LIVLLMIVVNSGTVDEVINSMNIVNLQSNEFEKPVHVKSKSTREQQNNYYIFFVASDVERDMLRK